MKLLGHILGLISVSALSGSIVHAQDSDIATGEIAAHAAHSAAEASPGPPMQETMYCGGETTRAVVDAYFAELQEAIEAGRPASYFNRFVADRFSTLRDESYLAFDREDFNSVTPRFFSMSDWRAIAERGSARLEDVGYRGCMFDHGKVWFQGYGDTFELRAINHDLPWVELD